jgi:hypothetical protein
MNFIKKFNVFGWVTVASAVAALIAMIIYIASGTTGFMAGQTLNAVPIVLTIIAIIAVIADVYFADKLDKRIVGAILIGVVVLLAVSLCLFIVAREQLFADIYFIPVNHPVTEDASLNASIAGIVFYLISIVCVIVAGFADKLVKSN